MSRPVLRRVLSTASAVALGLRSVVVSPFRAWSPAPSGIPSGIPDVPNAAAVVSASDLAGQWWPGPRNVRLMGTVWPGGDDEPFPDGVVVVDAGGTISFVGRAGDAPPPLEGAVLLGDRRTWIGPAVTDTHVHLTGADVADTAHLGVVGARSLDGFPLRARSAGPHDRMVTMSVPLAPGPAGPNGASDPHTLVRRALAGGATAVTLGTEDAWSEASPETFLTFIDAAHDLGLPVLVHALSTTGALRAVDAGADELVLVPTDPLAEADVAAIAESGVGVTPLLQWAYRSGTGHVASRNVALLHAAGVPVRYGSGFGCENDLPGVDPRELERLAAAGLGRLGALRAATDVAAHAPGLTPLRLSGRLRAGETARLVMLPTDPLVEPAAWRSPSAVCVGARLYVGAGVSWGSEPGPVAGSARARPEGSPASPVPSS